MQRRKKSFKITCPKCKGFFEKELDTVIVKQNSERFLEEDLDFTHLTCPSCSHEFIFNYNFAYLDEDKKFLVVHDPKFEEKKARLAFISSLALVDRLKKDELDAYELRITSTYDNLREKILIFEDGYSDKLIELSKYFLLESEDFAYKFEDVRDFYYKGDGEFILTNKASMTLKFSLPMPIYELLGQKFADKLSLDKSYMVNRSWAVEFLKNTL